MYGAVFSLFMLFILTLSIHGIAPESNSLYTWIRIWKSYQIAGNGRKEEKHQRG